MPGSNAHFQEMSAHVSLTVATSNSFSDKKTTKIFIYGLFF